MYCSVLTKLTVGTISAYSVMKIKQRELNESLRKERGKPFCIFGDEGQQKSLRKKKEVKKKKYIYMYKSIELLATTLTTSTS